MAGDERKLRYIDIGANLLDGMYQGEYHGKAAHAPDLDAVLERAWRAGVAKIIITAGTLEESRRALDLARTESRLFCTVGVHPTRSNEFDEAPGGAEGHLRQLQAVLEEGRAEGKVVAVGECGLDYDRLQFCDKAAQKRGFAAQFALAAASRLPMFLHMRAAADDFAAIVREHLSSFHGGVVHSFTGGREEAEDMLTLHPRMLIGINGCSLKTHDNLDNMAAIPLRRLMLETDAPWCDMRPTHASAEHVATRREAVDKKKHTRDCLVKGRNEPCNIDQVLEAVAGHRGLHNKYALAETVYRVTDDFFFGAGGGAGGAAEGT